MLYKAYHTACFCILLGMIYSPWVLAQSVGIGTALPDPSARLHIEDTQRGLLIPRLPLSARNLATPVTAPATGLLVFNTATAGTGQNRVWPGFYWWNGTEWVRLLIYPNEAWQIDGNWGTNPTIHFLGTIDNQPLRIRVDNQQTLQLNTNFSLQRDAGGNPRGADAVDLQRLRSAPDQVASGIASVISGGQNNRSLGPSSVVGGGEGNRALTQGAVVTGGLNNQAGDPNNPSRAAFVGGGEQNQALGTHSAVVGGTQNQASALTSFVGGGEFNLAGGHASVVVGGIANQAGDPNGPTAFVGGGDQNNASGWGSAIVGGSLNQASGLYSFIGGGQNNRAQGMGSVIGGGNYNLAQAIGATIGGGTWDTIASPAEIGFIGGGTRNAIRNGKYNFIGAGIRNKIEADTSCIGGGVDNYIGPNLGTAFIGGGSRNSIQKTAVGGDVQGSTIVAGTRNRMDWYPNWAVIGGGVENYVGTEGSVICGGGRNWIGITPPPHTSGANTIGGGGGNSCINYELQTIGGGGFHLNESWGSTIAGGQENTIYTADLINLGFWNFIGGGGENVIDEGAFSAILGGFGNGIENFAWTSFIIGESNTINGGWTSVAIGSGNTITNCGSAYVVGLENTLSNADHAYVFGHGLQPTQEDYRFYCFGPGTATSPSGFLVVNRLDGDYPIHVGTNATNGNGAYLTAGGVWTNASSRAKKDRFTP